MGLDACQLRRADLSTELSEPLPRYQALKVGNSTSGTEEIQTSVITRSCLAVTRAYPSSTRRP